MNPDNVCVQKEREAANYVSIGKGRKADNRNVSEIDDIPSVAALSLEVRNVLQLSSHEIDIIGKYDIVLEDNNTPRIAFGVSGVFMNRTVR